MLVSGGFKTQNSYTDVFETGLVPVFSYGCQQIQIHYIDLHKIIVYNDLY